MVGAAIGVFATLHGGGGNHEAASGAADNAATPPAALAPLTAPGCRNVVAPGSDPEPRRVRSRWRWATQPFAVTTTPDGKFTFVTRKDAIVVLTSHGGLAPTVDHVISVPACTTGWC